MRGIEPPSLAWKAKVLPLNYTRIFAKPVSFTESFSANIDCNKKKKEFDKKRAREK